MSSVEQRVQEFFASLERALGGPHEQSDAVQAELRADLEAQVGDAVAAGLDRDLAWTQALEAMGEPDALARSMRGALPPALSRSWERNLRMIASGLVAAWALWLLFEWRSADYGIDLRVTMMLLGMHLPLVLLLWPGLVWRWNPLFYTGSSLALVFLLVLLDWWTRNSTITYALEFDATPPAWELADLVPFAFAGLIALTFWMIQRRRQRWLALAWTLALLAPVEAVHQVEEGFFRAEARHAEAWVEARLQERGSLPTSEEFKQDYEPRWLSRLHYYPTDGTDPDGSPAWALHWSRATQRNHELGYHSDGTIWGND